MSVHVHRRQGVYHVGVRAEASENARQTRGIQACNVSAPSCVAVQNPALLCSVPHRQPYWVLQLCSCYRSATCSAVNESWRKLRSACSLHSPCGAASSSELHSIERWSNDVCLVSVGARLADVLVSSRVFAGSQAGRLGQRK